CGGPGTGGGHPAVRTAVPESRRPGRPVRGFDARWGAELPDEALESRSVRADVPPGRVPGAGRATPSRSVLLPRGPVDPITVVRDTDPGRRGDRAVRAHAGGRSSVQLPLARPRRRLCGSGEGGPVRQGGRAGGPRGSGDPRLRPRPAAPCPAPDGPPRDR